VSGLLRHFRNTLITGLLILVPVVITYWILRFIFESLDGILQPVIRPILGRGIPGVGIAVLVVFIYMMGLVGANVLGKKLIYWGQQLLLKFPIVNFVYSAAKELIESFSGQRTTGLKRVVMIEYPRADVWAIGFLTSTTIDEKGRVLGVVYIPTAPTPNSGWVAILPMEQVYDTDLSVPIAMRMVLSGGIVAPPQIRKRAAMSWP
jgi:uncharacterized membrane protein